MGDERREAGDGTWDKRQAPDVIYKLVISIPLRLTICIIKNYVIEYYEFIRISNLYSMHFAVGQDVQYIYLK